MKQSMSTLSPILPPASLRQPSSTHHAAAGEQILLLVVDAVFAAGSVFGTLGRAKASKKTAKQGCRDTYCDLC